MITIFEPLPGNAIAVLSHCPNEELFLIFDPAIRLYPQLARLKTELLSRLVGEPHWVKKGKFNLIMRITQQGVTIHPQLVKPNYKREWQQPPATGQYRVVGGGFE
jgi:hypothetical protein